MSFDEVTKIQIANLIEAASRHDVANLQKLIDDSTFTECKAVDVQDPSTGYTPLHAAIASLHESKAANGATADEHKPHLDVSSKETDAAHDTVRLLLENGAIWNQLDRNDETPGCIAFRLGLETLYQAMVDAGVRAEMLLNRLDEYEELENDIDEELDVDEEQVDSTAPVTTPQIEVIETGGAGDALPKIEDNPGAVSAKYLSSALSMSGGKILDDERNGVMMAWESDIMKLSADSLLKRPGLKILNIGFGMGIIDTHIQSHQNKPAEHHIIEAHPDVINQMMKAGWSGKPGVTVHPGKWQDVLPKLIEEGTTFDTVYYDTFAESYKDFKDFFTEHLLTLLEQDGTWSYFNGMGADRQISYDVYQKIVEMDLFEAGFEVEWEDVDLPDLSFAWDGVRRRYWDIQKYRLPVCKFMD